MEIDKEIVDKLLANYQKPEDIVGENGLLKQLTKALVERAMEAELTTHLGYEKHDPAGYGSGNSRNGASKKKLKGDFGEIDLAVPRDRHASFEPQIVPKGQTRFTGFDDKILSMYARGMTTRDSQGHLEEIYGVEVSPTLISNVTEAVLEEVRAWQSRPLDPLYPIVYLDALMVKMRDNGVVQNRAVYVALGVTREGRKEVLGLWSSARRQILAAGLDGIQESRSAGYLHRLCRRTKRLPAGHRDGLSADHRATLHCALGARQFAICELERAPHRGARLASDLSGGNGRRSRTRAGAVCRALGSEVPHHQCVMEEALGADHPVVCLSTRDPKNHLHDECGGVFAHDLAQGDQNARFVSE